MFSILTQIQTVPATGENTVDFTWLFIKMLLVLGIVVIGVILILKFAVPHIGILKKLHHGRHFRVIGRHGLEPKKSLYLVRVCKKNLVLGVSDHGINLITEVFDADLEEEED